MSKPIEELSTAGIMMNGIPLQEWLNKEEGTRKSHEIKTVLNESMFEMTRIKENSYQKTKMKLKIEKEMPGIIRNFTLPEIRQEKERRSGMEHQRIRMREAKGKPVIHLMATILQTILDWNTNLVTLNLYAAGFAKQDQPILMTPSTIEKYFETLNNQELLDKVRVSGIGTHLGNIYRALSASESGNLMTRHSLPGTKEHMYQANDEFYKIDFDSLMGRIRTYNSKYWRSHRDQSQKQETKQHDASVKPDEVSLEPVPSLLSKILEINTSLGGDVDDEKVKRLSLNEAASVCQAIISAWTQKLLKSSKAREEIQLPTAEIIQLIKELPRGSSLRKEIDGTIVISI